MHTSCGAKILATSRDQIQNLGDITEKVYQLRELSNNFTIQLLEKKALREIGQGEIDEILAMKQAKKALYDKPFQKKDLVKSLEDHHLCTLLGGHPHAISLVAPLLQSRSLADLYSHLLKMMNGKNFM